jgi:hypothetical protein
LKYAITGQVAGDDVFITRHPIYRTLATNDTSLFPGNSYLDVEDICRFRAGTNYIEIYTGNNDDYPDKSDLWLGYINREYFQDSDLSFNSMYLTHKQLDWLYPSRTATTTNTAEANDPLPDSKRFIVAFTVVYDGFQEGPLFHGEDLLGIEYGALLEQTVTGERIDVTFSFDVIGAANTMPLSEPEKDTAASIISQLFFNRRITGINVYMAESQAGSSTNEEPLEEFRYIGTIDINDSNWALSTPDYQLTYQILGSLYTAAAGKNAEDRVGHRDLTRNYANADFAVFAGDRLALASVHTDEQRDSFVQITPTNQAQVNTPHNVPHNSFIDVQLYGVPKIIGFLESLERWVVFGENKILIIAWNPFSGPQV